MDAPGLHSDDGTAGASGLSRYRAPQNVAANPGTIVIKNDRGQAAFEIDGGARSTDDVIRVRHLASEGACLIQGGTLISGDAVKIVAPDATTLATIERIELSPVRDVFSIQVGPDTSWTVEGHVAQYEYRIRGMAGEIAEISRRWFRARDTFGIQVATGQNDLVVLAVAVCLDLMMRAGR